MKACLPWGMKGIGQYFIIDRSEKVKDISDSMIIPFSQGILHDPCSCQRMLGLNRTAENRVGHGLMGMKVTVQTGVEFVP